MKKGADFGKYDKYTYRICYGVTQDGKMDYSTPHYEFIKYCTCYLCARRLAWKRSPSNVLTVTTDDKSKFPEIKEILDKYTCGEKEYIGRKFILFLNGERKDICI